MIERGAEYLDTIIQVIQIITVYEDIPPGFAHPSQDAYFPDYNQIL